MKIKDFSLRFLPLFFLIVVWAIFSSPYFLQHKVPYPAQYQVSFFTPWNAYPEYAGPIKNNAISDVVTQLYPWKYFTIEELKKGTVPLWNPYSFSGTPHVANYQSAVFSPFNVLFFVLPFLDAWSLLVLLQPLLAGIFLYLFLRELKISKVGSLISSVSFMFCGFITVWMAYGTLSMTIAFLPLALFAIEKIFQKISVSSIFLLSLSVISLFFSGHFQIALYAALYLFAYVVFSFFRSKNTKALLYSCLGFGIGIVVSLFQILPSLAFYQSAVRSELFSNIEGIPWYYLLTVFAPDFFGNPVTRNDWLGHYAEWASFIGIIPLTLATCALFIRKQKSTIAFFFLTGIVAILFALDTPFQQFLSFLKVPIFSTSIPSRIIILLSFSFVVLAGFGFDFLLERIKQKSFKQITLLFFPVGIILAITWFAVLLFTILPTEQVSLAKRNLILPSLLFVSFVSIVLINFFTKSKKIFFILPFILLIFVTFDSLRFVQKWMPFESRAFVFPKVSVIDAMQKNIGQGRVYGDFGAYVDTYYHLPSIEGYDPLYSKRYGEFLQTAKTGQFAPAVRSLAHLDERGKYAQRVLDILGVILIYQPIAHSNQPFAFPIWEHPEAYPTVYRDDKFAVFRNTTAFPRVKLFSQYEIINDKKKLLETFFAEKFDYKNVLLLEENPGLSVTKELKGKVEILSYTPNKIIISVNSDHPAMLLLSDNYYPSWKAKVNGKEEKIFIADYTLRAIKVPQGKSVVEFYLSGLF